MMDRVYGVSEPDGVESEYVQGLRVAVSAALDYALVSIEAGEGRAPSVPTALLAQARLAARNQIGVDIVLRRYIAAYALLGDFIIAAAGEVETKSYDSLALVLQGNAGILDRLLVAITEEHRRELSRSLRSTSRRRYECVQRLLAGELIDTRELSYELAGFHIGLVGVGPGLVNAVEGLARRFDRRRLTVRCEDDTVWAWLGCHRAVDQFDLVKLADQARAVLPEDAALGIGEPAPRVGGWRLTHRQAKAALPVARFGRPTVARYGEVSLLAATLKDDLTATSLRELFLDPLRVASKNRRTDLLETLKAYFACGGAVSATASALKVTRRTVSNRIQVVEEELGSPLEAIAAELQTALRLADLDAHLERNANCETSTISSDQIVQTTSPGGGQC